MMNEQRASVGAAKSRAPLISHERLLQFLHYDPESGIWTWVGKKKRIILGSRAGAFDKDGYRIIKIDQKNYRSARLAVFYMTKEWPPFEVDHEDLNKANDKWGNLRPATKSQNMMNQTVQRDTKTGVKRAYFDKRRGHYTAEIMFNGKRHYLGSRSTAEEANALYEAAAKRLCAEFARAA